MADSVLAAKNDLNQARQNHGVFAFATDRDRKDGVGTIWNLAHDAAYRGDVQALEKILDEPDEMTGEVQYDANAQHPHDGRTLLQCCAPDSSAKRRKQANEAVLMTARVAVPHAGNP